MIRKSWRTEEANALSHVKIEKKQKQKTILATKWIDQLNFPVCKDIIFKSHLSIHSRGRLWEEETIPDQFHFRP